MPEFTVRVEICQTDCGTLREWRIVLGGATRGGLSSRHGYLPTSWPLLLDELQDIKDGLTSLLEGYASGLGGYQLEFDLPNT